MPHARLRPLSAQQNTVHKPTHLEVSLYTIIDSSQCNGTRDWRLHPRAVDGTPSQHQNKYSPTITGTIKQGKIYNTTSTTTTESSRVTDRKKSYPQYLRRDKHCCGQDIGHQQPHRANFERTGRLIMLLLMEPPSRPSHLNVELFTMPPKSMGHKHSSSSTLQPWCYRRKRC